MVVDIVYLQQSQQEINQFEVFFVCQCVVYLVQLMFDVMQCVQWLKVLCDLLFKEQQVLIEVIDWDFSVCFVDEILFVEIMFSLYGIYYVVKCVKKWMKFVCCVVGL